MRPPSLALALLLTLLPMVAAQAQDGRHSEPPPLRPRIALVLKTLANPFFIEMERGAHEAADKVGAELVVRAAAQETSVDEQIDIVRALIGARVAAIVIAPADSVKLVPVLRLAKDSGIAIVNVDNRLDRDFAMRSGLGEVPFVSVDNVKAAYLSAVVIARAATGPVEAAVIEGIRSAANAQARKIGALKAFAQFPNIRVVAMETANWRADEAHVIARKILAEHPRLGLLFCANDVMALGAIRYLREQDIRHVRVAGFDALPEAVAAVRSGDLAATLDQQAAAQGGLGVQMAADLIHGVPVRQETLVDVRVVASPTSP